MKNYCLQCNAEIETNTEDGLYNVCVHPECPNYGLLQVSEDEIFKHLNK